MSPCESSSRKPRQVDQACAIPFRRAKGRVEFCLITSSSGRWIFPKGFIDEGTSSSETALNEAYEEAGLRGHIVGDPLGHFEVAKQGNTLSVVALLMEVERCEKQWPESDVRKRQWVSRKEAIKLLDRRELTQFVKAADHTLPCE